MIKIKRRRIRTARKGGSAVGFPLNATSKLPLIFLFPPLYFPLLISLVMCHVIPTTTTQLNLLENVGAYYWSSKLLFFISLTQVTLYNYLKMFFFFNQFLKERRRGGKRRYLIRFNFLMLSPTKLLLLPNRLATTWGRPLINWISRRPLLVNLTAL